MSNTCRSSDLLQPTRVRRASRPLTVRIAATLLVGSSLQACGDSAASGSPGTLRVLLEPEDTILDGIRPGDDVASIADGWRVTYDKYLLAVGKVAVEYATDRSVRADDREVFVIDLMQVPENGETLWEVENLQPGRWNFGFEFAEAGSKSRRHDSVAKVDYDRMSDARLTYLVTGTLTKEDGRSCPPTRLADVPGGDSAGENAAGDACYLNPSIEFEFAARSAAALRNCELDGVAGFALAEAATVSEAITVHGDHLFFNGFPAGSEGGVKRLAQIWADTDLNVDGTIDLAEAGDILIADMAEWDERYQLGGAPPVETLTTLRDVVAGQLMTQGHMNGEGECEVLPAD